MAAPALNAERLRELSGGVLPTSAVRLDESLPIPAEERRAWERRLNRYLNSCGCAEGTVGLFAGGAIALIVSFVQNEPWPAWEIAMIVALPIVLLVGGKTLGRWLDRLRFRMACKSLLSRLAVDITEGD